MRDWESFLRGRLSLEGRSPALRDRIVRELADQLRDASEDGRLRGMTPADAEQFALAQLGDWESFTDGLRQATSTESASRLQSVSDRLERHRRPGAGWRACTAAIGADLLQAVRGLLAEPGFTSVALIVLALGIGATTAVFSVVDAVVLRGLPYDQADRIVSVVEHDPKHAATFGEGRTTAPTFLDWRRLQTPFEAIAAAGGANFRIHSPAGEPTEATGQMVTWEFFRVLRTAPSIGRPFSPEDEVQGNQKIVLLGHAFWQRQYGGAADVVGRTIELNEESWRIVGVMPAGFTYPLGTGRPTDLYMPLWFYPAERSRDSGHAYGYTAIARLKAGVSVAQAQDAMTRLAAALDRQYPKWSPGRTARVVRLQETLVGKVRPWMLMLLGAVGLVLAIACANVANLMLARATTRRHDAAVRAALGAPRWRLLRAPLVEGLVLASAGALGGLALAFAGVRVLRVWLPFDLPRAASVAIDWRVLGAAAGATVLTGLLTGLAPGIQALRQDARGLTSEGRSPLSAGAVGRRTRNALVVAEVALAVLLLVGAGLFGRSFWNVARIDPGFDCARVLTLEVGLPIEGRQLDDEFARRSKVYLSQVLDSVRRVPGVMAAGTVAGGLPLSGGWSRWSVELPGRGELTGEGDDIDVRRVSPDYLKVMRIPLLRGRSLGEQDGETSEAVVVVNRAAARKYWPGRDAIGQHITMGDRDRLVVGIVGDIHQLGPEIPPRQEAYLPAAQNRGYGATLVVRTAGNPLDLLPSLKSAIWRVNREQRLEGDVLTLDGYMERLVGQRRFLMALTLLLGAVGLVIATAGVYGVMRYTVVRRTNEVGLRMALGATPAIVLATVVREGAVLLAAGLALGCAGAWALGSSVQTFLFQVRPNDPVVFATAVGTLGVTGLLASLVPARRAALVDPLVALRQN